MGDVKEARLCLSELREAPKVPEVKDLRDAVAAGIEELFDAQVGGAVLRVLWVQGRGVLCCGASVHDLSAIRYVCGELACQADLS